MEILSSCSYKIGKGMASIFKFTHTHTHTHNSLVVRPSLSSGCQTYRNGIFHEGEEKRSTCEDIYVLARNILVWNGFSGRQSILEYCSPWISKDGFGRC